MRPRQPNPFQLRVQLVSVEEWVGEGGGGGGVEEGIVIIHQQIWSGWATSSAFHMFVASTLFIVLP